MRRTTRGCRCPTGSGRRSRPERPSCNGNRWLLRAAAPRDPRPGGSLGGGCRTPCVLPVPCWAPSSVGLVLVVRGAERPDGLKGRAAQLDVVRVRTGREVDVAAAACVVVE